MGHPGDLSSKKVKNTYKAIVQYDGASKQIFDGTGSRINDLSVTRITASKASLSAITDLGTLSASNAQIDKHFSVSGSTFLGDNCGQDQVKITGNTWVSGSLTVSGSCQGSFRSIGQAKFIYLQNPTIEDQKPARVTRGMVRGKYNVPRFGGQNAALDVYGNAVITGSLIVTDTVFAQEFHSEHVSASIIYTSGSTKFGNDFSDTMTVTGSIFQSGSDSYFLNGIGIGITGSNKGGTFDEPGQDNPVNFSHLLRIDDPGHDGLSYKKGNLIYASVGRGTGAPLSSSATIRIRDEERADDIMVISAVSKSIFFSTNDQYNVGIAVPSGSNSQVDENLVVSSSTNARVKIESATAATSASLYLESGQGVWEITAASGSTGTNNQLSESLVFRTRNSRDIKNTFGANSTYTEALRLNNRGRAGFNIPSANNYDYPQQVQISGSLNIIKGRTVDINAGTFHNSDAINGIFFNNEKIIHTSGSNFRSNYFFGFRAGYDPGDTGASGDDAQGNIGIGFESVRSLTDGKRNTGVGYLALSNLTSGDNNIGLGSFAGYRFTNNMNNVAIGTLTLSATTADGDQNIAIGNKAIGVGVVTGNDNIAIGTTALEDLTSGTLNIALGQGAGANLTTGGSNIAVGSGSIGIGVVTGNDNVALGNFALEDLTSGNFNIAIGSGSLASATDNIGNVAIGFESLKTSANDGDKNVAIGYQAMKTGDVSGTDNVALGSNALDNLTTGTDNIAIGSNASDGTTTAADTIAIGHDAMSGAVTTGDNNIAIGKLALKGMVGGNKNIGIGYRALRDTSDTATRNVAIGNEVAFDGVITGADNIIMGTNAASHATSLSENIIIGHKAVSEGAVTGDRNIIVGHQAANVLTSGNHNIILGVEAGASVATNTKNVIIGSGSNATNGLTNAFVIGTGAKVQQANSMVLGSKTGERFRIGMGGITKPNATLEVSGTVNITGSLTVSGSSTFTNIGTAVMSGTLESSKFPAMRALMVSGTSTFHGNTYITGNLIVSDIVIAQEFHTEFVSASIAFSSGSTKMGDTSDDVHMISGSVRVSGSGVHYFMGKQRSGLIMTDDKAKLGINTMLPTKELHVVGDISVGSGSHQDYNLPSYVYHNSDDDTHIQLHKNRLALRAGGYDLQLTGSEAHNNALVVNSAGAAMNMRIAGDTEQHLLFVSGGANHTEHNILSNTVVTNIGIGTGITSVGNIGIKTSSPSKALTVSGSISASGVIYTNYIASQSAKRNVGIVINANITASGYISASGFISASHILAPSASFSNLRVTGSGAAGTGSFGRIDAERVFIHNHELIGGSGLSVIGTTSNFGPYQGTDGNQAHTIHAQGHVTSSGVIWASGSGTYEASGKISASTIVVTNNLEIGGNISGSWISASKGMFSRGPVQALGYISSSDVIYTNHLSYAGARKTANVVYVTGSLSTNANITASGNYSGSRNSIIYTNHLSRGNDNTQQVVHITGSTSITGHITASGNISGSINSTGSFGYLELSSQALYPEFIRLKTGNRSYNFAEAEGGTYPGLKIVRNDIPGHDTTIITLTAENSSGSLTIGGDSFNYGGGGVPFGIQNNIIKNDVAKFGAPFVMGSQNVGLSMGFTTGSQGGGVAAYSTIESFISTGTHRQGDGSSQAISFRIGSNGSGSRMATITGDGNLIVSNSISSSGGIYASSGYFSGNVSASGYISSSGNLYGQGIGVGTYTSQSTIPAGNIHLSGDISGSTTSTGSFGVLVSQNYRSFYVAAAGMTPSVTNGASATTTEFTDGTKNTYDYLAFDGATREYANFQLTMPDEWDRGTIRVKFYWRTSDTATADVVWGMNAAAINQNEGLDSTQNTFTTVTDGTINDISHLCISPTTSDITVSGASTDIDDLILFRVIRAAAAAADTYNNKDAHLLGVRIQYRERAIAEEKWS